MSGTEYKCTVVYSVCGHSMLERPNQQVEMAQREVSRRIPFERAGVLLPKGTKCRAGWCLACSDYFRPDDIDNTTAIDNYWRFKAQQRWIYPVHPKQVPRSVLCSRPASPLVRAAVVDVAACLDSLFGQVHSTHAKEIRFLHKCGPRYIEAANIIRDSTLRWARWVEYMNKPLPANPGSKKQKECREPKASASFHTKREKKARPAPLRGLDDESQRFLTFTDEEGDRHWIPGAHRTPTHESPSPPPRTSQSLSFCSHHGRVDASCVDMTCHRCKVVFLDESKVSPGSKIVKHHSAPAFSSEFYAYAAEGKCSCKFLKPETCSPCKARAQISERKELEYEFL